MIVAGSKPVRILHKKVDQSIFLVPKTRISGCKCGLFSELLILIISLLGCASILVGPLNEDGNAVHSLLYANNETCLVTFWDEQLEGYRTYNQESGDYLSKVIFELEKESKSFEIIGGQLAVKTQHHNHGLQMYSEEGCIACHEQ